MLKIAYQKGYLTALIKLGIAPVKGALKYLKGNTQFKPLIDAASKYPTAPKFNVNLHVPLKIDEKLQQISPQGLKALLPTRKDLNSLSPLKKNKMFEIDNLSEAEEMIKKLQNRQELSKEKLESIVTNLDIYEALADAKKRLLRPVPSTPFTVG